jgi:hypothetical protein
MPQTVFARFLAALNSRDSSEASALIHPVDLARWREGQLFSLASWYEQVTRSDAQPAEGDTELVVHLSSWTSSQLPAVLERYGARAVPALGSTSLAEAAAWPAAELLRRILDARWTSNPAGTDHLDVEVLNEVIEGDSVAHVLYRPAGAEPRDQQALEVVTLRRDAATWKVCLSATLLAALILYPDEVP